MFYQLCWRNTYGYPGNGFSMASFCYAADIAADILSVSGPWNVDKGLNVLDEMKGLWVGQKEW